MAANARRMSRRMKTWSGWASLSSIKLRKMFSTPRFAAHAVLHRPRGLPELNAVHSNERLQRHAAEEAATGQGSHLVVPLGLGEQAA